MYHGLTSELGKASTIKVRLYDISKQRLGMQIEFVHYVYNYYMLLSLPQTNAYSLWI